MHRLTLGMLTSVLRSRTWLTNGAAMHVTAVLENWEFESKNDRACIA